MIKGVNIASICIYPHPVQLEASIADACCAVLTSAISNPPAIMAPIIANVLRISTVSMDITYKQYPTLYQKEMLKM